MNSSPSSLALFTQAVAFAAEKHRNQRRKDTDASPYINHPIALANVLANEAGVDDTIVLSAALLHDTIEDTQTSGEEIAKLFGAPIAAIVLEVTDDKSLDKLVRKQHQIEDAPNLYRGAKHVKLADKICNLRDLLAAPPADWSTARKQAYFSWAAEVVNGLRGVHPQMESIFDELRSRHVELS